MPEFLPRVPTTTNEPPRNLSQLKTEPLSGSDVTEVIVKFEVVVLGLYAGVP